MWQREPVNVKLPSGPQKKQRFHRCLALDEVVGQYRLTTGFRVRLAIVLHGTRALTTAGHGQFLHFINGRARLASPSLLSLAASSLQMPFACWPYLVPYDTDGY